MSRGEEALHSLAQTQLAYRYVLVNHQLDDMTGITLIQRIRQHPQWQNMALILLASVNQQLNSDDLQKVPFFLRKPLSEARLHAFLLDIAHGIQPDQHFEGTTVGHNLPQQTLTGLNILLAEDNFINQEVGRNILLNMGYRVSIAENGLEVLSALSRQRFDLILMDCHMPEMDGFSTTRKIREQEEGSERHVPIIALTANAMQGDKERCFLVGMDDYLSKPLRPEALRTALKRWLIDKNAQALNLSDFKADVSKPVPVAEDPTPGDNVPYVDEKLLQRMQSEMPQHLPRLINLYLQQLPTYFAEMQQAQDNHNGEELFMVAHKFKGASASLGVKRVVELCKNIEQAAKAEDFATAHNHIYYLEDILENTKPILQAFVMGNGG